MTNSRNGALDCRCENIVNAARKLWQPFLGAVS
jgi:hypothetical protein